MANAETDLMNRILVALCQAFPSRSVWWRQNAGRVRTDKGAWVSLGPPGIADLMGTLDGRAVAVEVKQPAGKQREAQRNFQKAWEQAGGVYVVARSPEAAVSALQALSAPA